MEVTAGSNYLSEGKLPQVSEREPRDKILSSCEKDVVSSCSRGKQTVLYGIPL